MFLGIGGILGVLWVLGMMYGYKMGGAIYILLAAAIVMVGFGLRQWWQRPVVSNGWLVMQRLENNTGRDGL